MEKENTIKKSDNKHDVNEKFYQLIKELIDTNSLIIKKIDAISEKLGSSTKQKSVLELWKEM